MLSEEITRLTNQAEEVTTFEVEKGAIKKYADAVDDRNPLYWDEEYATSSDYGTIVAPPGFFGWPTTWLRDSAFPVFSGAMLELIDTLSEAGYSQTIDGSIDYEFFLPVRAGDTLFATSVIKDIKERKDATGQAVFVVTETTFTNQNNDPVAKIRQIFVNR